MDYGLTFEVNLTQLESHSLSFSACFPGAAYLFFASTIVVVSLLHVWRLPLRLRNLGFLATKVSETKERKPHRQKVDLIIHIIVFEVGVYSHGAHKM